MLGQTVPSTGNSNREGPIAVGGQPSTTDKNRKWSAIFQACSWMSMASTVKDRAQLDRDKRFVACIRVEVARQQKVRR